VLWETISSMLRPPQINVTLYYSTFGIGLKVDGPQYK
jgi:hypothetical protein